MRIGSVAGTTSAYGYRVIKHTYDDGKAVFLKLHRVAFAIMTGHWPTDGVDHINRITDDNRWANLRQSDVKLNNSNRRMPKRRENRCIRPTRFGFDVTVSRLYVGHYSDIASAIAARDKAASERQASGIKRGRPFKKKLGNLC